MPCDNHGQKCNGEECANKNLDNGLYRMVFKNGIMDLKTLTFKYQ